MPRVTLNQRPMAVNESKTEGRAKDSKKPCGQNPRVFSGLEQLILEKRVTKAVQGAVGLFYLAPMFSSQVFTETP